jgi:hypothetical protein
MKILIIIDYRDYTGKFWFDSSIKNKIVKYNPDEKTIHEIIKELCEEEGMSLTYKGKPQGNVFIDGENGEPKRIGYIYRGKSEIYDRNMTTIGNFDVWVTIKQIIDFDIEIVD